VNQRLISISEASERLGVSSFTTRRLIQSEEIKAVRISRRVMIPETELQRVMDEGCGKHASK
jgi:excisionase family DNA binding protein